MSESYPAGRPLLNLQTATRAELFFEAQWLSDNHHDELPYAVNVRAALAAAQRGDPRPVMDAAVKGAVEAVGGPSSPENVQGLIRAVCKELEEMLVSKNRSYGNSAIDPLRVFSRASPREQIRVRIDDKLSRLARGTGEMNEDTVKDLAGYLVLEMVAERIERASRGE